MSVDVEVHTIAHSKVPVNDKLRCKGLKDAGFFTQLNSCCQS